MQKYKKEKYTIIGLDPGNTRTGFGIIQKYGASIKYINSGVLDIKNSKDIGEQLYNLEKELKKIIKKYNPDIAGLEELFFYKNNKTVIKVAEARGVIYKTLYENKIPTKEFTPLQVKSLLVGYGKASKKSINKIVSLILKKDLNKALDDETDALAIAIITSGSMFYS